MRHAATLGAGLVAVASAWSCLGSLDYLGEGVVDAGDSGDGGPVGGGGAGGAASSTGGGGMPCDDVLSDPDNCGVCGHSCFGGDCERGQCQPVLVAGMQDQPYGIGVDGEHVYWSNFGSRDIRRAPLKRRGADELVAASGGVQFVPTDVLVLAMRVVWVNTEAGTLGNGQALMAWLKTGGDPAGFGTSSSDGNTGLAGDGSTFYFANYGFGEIREAPLAAGYVPIAMDQTGPTRVAADATHVYWVNQAEGPGGVMRVERQRPGVPQSLAPDVKTATNLALGADHVYVTSSPQVLRVPKQGGTALPLAERQFNPVGIGVSGTRVYWVNAGAEDSSTGELVTVDSETTADPVVLAGGLASPLSIVVDDEQIYWTNTGGSVPRAGSVMRMAR